MVKGKKSGEERAAKRKVRKSRWRREGRAGEGAEDIGARRSREGQRVEARLGGSPEEDASLFF